MTGQRAPRAGLLPFYLKLYDDLLPDRRAGFDGYLERIAAGLEARGLAVAAAPVCRVADEFAAAVRQFEEADVDCLVTLHLAYSPSLEALEPFCRTRLPLLLLDATMDAEFGPGVSPERIMYNHGVHGVMDFASMLRRRERPFEIVAGHDAEPRTLDRAAEFVRAAVASRALRATRALRVGDAFAGMGDFAVAEEVLAARLGIRVRQVGIAVLDEAVQAVTEEALAAELALDRERFACDLDPAVLERSVRVGLGLRHLIAAGDHQAVSVNFQAFDSPDRPACTVPFLEIAKAMARGIGYAGEGDVLTAALVGALARAFGAVTFTEIFCADWAGDRLFLSHMGEISPAVAADRPRLCEKPFPFGGALNPAVLTCAVRPGPAVFVNLAPGPGDRFSLIVAPVQVVAEDESLDPAMRDVVRVWVRPPGRVAPFLEAYSRAGGTHHSALLLGEHAAAVAAFGRMSGLEVVEIGAG
jgi:L-arabinose isomerase